MKSARLYGFVGAVVVAGAVSGAFQDWGALLVFPTEDLFGLAILGLLALFSEALSLSLDVGKASGSDSVSTSISFIPVFVALLLFGPAAALALMLTAGVFAELAIRRKPAIKVFFNAGQWALACGLGGLVFTALNGSTLMQVGVEPRALLVPFGGFAIIFVTVTHAAVAGVISLNGEVGLKKVWRNVIGESGGNVLFDLLISPVAFGIALLYIPLHTTGLLIAFLPLFFIRHSYYINLRLQKANKDLLTALVKALETRDPYTSGHSLRVASLARDIAETLGLSQRQIADVETAALLHDIGKIDAIYEEIIQKPSGLSPTERLVIESHVIKGVELLRTLSSFSDDIICRCGITMKGRMGGAIRVVCAEQRFQSGRRSSKSATPSTRCCLTGHTEKLCRSLRFAANCRSMWGPSSTWR